MLKELFRTEPKTTLNERLRPGTIERLQIAFHKNVDFDVAKGIVSNNGQKIVLDTLLDCLTALANESGNLYAEIKRLEARVAELEGNGG